MQINRKTFFILALVTLIGFSIIGFVIIGLFQARSIESVFSQGAPWPYQLFRGAVFGTIAVLTLLWIIRHPIMDTSRDFFTKLVHDADLRVVDILFLSFAAGVGEEILFRAGIQELLTTGNDPTTGIWVTAVIFVGLHGYLNPFDWRMSIYGVLMVVVSAGLGYLYFYIGIYAAMTAHFLIDAVLFSRFRYFPYPLSKPGENGNGNNMPPHPFNNLSEQNDNPETGGRDEERDAEKE